MSPLRFCRTTRILTAGLLSFDIFLGFQIGSDEISATSEQLWQTGWFFKKV